MWIFCYMWMPQHMDSNIRKCTLRFVPSNDLDQPVNACSLHWQLCRNARIHSYYWQSEKTIQMYRLICRGWSECSLGESYISSLQAHIHVFSRRNRKNINSFLMEKNLILCSMWEKGSYAICKGQNEGAHLYSLLWTFSVHWHILQCPLILLADNAGPGQPAHLCRLIRACIVHKLYKGPFICIAHLDFWICSCKKIQLLPLRLSCLSFRHLSLPKSHQEHWRTYHHLIKI